MTDEERERRAHFADVYEAYRNESEVDPTW